ncbi:hypothetical protein J6590_105817 [Homalodisca vitripennis]|nr:hypothetical protein J6590_105817 [Homalodisca vitripennis]
MIRFDLIKVVTKLSSEAQRMGCKKLAIVARKSLDLLEKSKKKWIWNIWEHRSLECMNLEQTNWWVGCLGGFLAIADKTGGMVKCRMNISTVHLKDIDSDTTESVLEAIIETLGDKACFKCKLEGHVAKQCTLKLDNFSGKRVLFGEAEDLQLQEVDVSYDTGINEGDNDLMHHTVIKLGAAVVVPELNVRMTTSTPWLVDVNHCVTEYLVGITGRNGKGAGFVWMELEIGRELFPAATHDDWPEVIELGEFQSFTAAEVLCVSKRIKEGKAAGPDQIPPEIVKRFGENHVEKCTEMITLSI